MSGRILWIRGEDSFKKLHRLLRAVDTFSQQEGLPFEKAQPLMRAAALEAVSLDPTLAEAHVARRAIINGALGNTDRMFSGFEEMLEREPQRVGHLMREPEFSPFRQDERFTRLLRRMNQSQ